MKSSFIRLDKIWALDQTAFETQKPFPWHEFTGLLTERGFQELYRDFPPLDWFIKHEGRYRRLGQRPHNRYLLAYDRLSKHQNHLREKGKICYENLPNSWKALIEELERPDGYKGFIKSIFKNPHLTFQYEWHVSYEGCEVSPHADASWRGGNHLFYFNTAEDWDPKWGGETLILGEKRVKSKAPDFFDFNKTVIVQNAGGHSLLFKNSSKAWHGVKPLRCPPGKYRRVFIVMFIPKDFPETIFEASSSFFGRAGSCLKKYFTRGKAHGYGDSTAGSQ